MTSVFAEDGTMVPVSVLAVEPNTVTALRTPETDGYSAVQLGAGTVKNLTKPRAGQLKNLPSVRDADVVHVVEAGRLVESGSWAELMSRPHGRFRRLWASQAGEDGIPEPEAPVDARSSVAG